MRNEIAMGDPDQNLSRMKQELQLVDNLIDQEKLVLEELLERQNLTEMEIKEYKEVQKEISRIYHSMYKTDRRLTYGFVEGTVATFMSEVPFDGQVSRYDPGMIGRSKPNLRQTRRHRRKHDEPERQYVQRGFIIPGTEPGCSGKRWTSRCVRISRRVQVSYMSDDEMESLEKREYWNEILNRKSNGEP